MPLIAIITAGAGELGTAAAAATTAEAAAAAAAAKAAAIAAAETAAATTAATTAGTTAAASALPGVVGGASPALSAAAPTAEGIATGAQAMSPEISANMLQSQVAAQNAGAQTANMGIQGGANPVLTQAGPAPTVPQGIDQALNVQGGANPSLSNGLPNGGLDAYGQFTQAPGPIDPAAAAKPYVNGPPSGGIGNPIDPNANLLKGVDYAEMPGVDVPHAGTQATTGLQKGIESALKFSKDYPLATTIGMSALGSAMNQPSSSGAPPKKQYARKDMSGFQASEPSTIEYNPIFKPTPYADGGIASYAVGGPVETMSAQNAISGNMMYPQSQLQTDMYSNPMVQRPMPTNVIQSGIDAPVSAYTGEPRFATGGSTKAEANYSKMMGVRTPEQIQRDQEYLEAYAKKEMAGSINTDSDVDTRTKDPLNASLTSLKKIGKRVGIKPVDLPKSNTTDSNVFHAAANGGIMHSLGGYSDGGRLLRGPGDGVSDSIPATIGNRQPARLADGEFVVPARIVSELGNGSTEAGARKLYQMMERIQADRKKSIGKGKVAVNSKATKHLPK
jgi:hypothetical protein